jgi:hypothetical protein
MRKHEKKVSNALKKECDTLEGECADLYEQTYRRVLLTALNTCVDNMSRLNLNLSFVSNRYSSANAIITQFHAILRETTTDDKQADNLEYRFTCACVDFDMEVERMMVEEELESYEGWEIRFMQYIHAKSREKRPVDQDKQDEQDEQDE